MRKLTGILTTALIATVCVSPAFAADVTCPVCGTDAFQSSTDCKSNIVNYTGCSAGDSSAESSDAATTVAECSEATYNELSAKYEAALSEYNSLKAELEKEEQELAMLKAKEQELSQRYTALSSDVAELRNEVNYRTQLEQRIAALKARLTTAKSEVETLREKFMSLPRTYTVVRGDTLWGIASKSYIYNDPWQWPLIYRANRDKITKSPHLIYPNQTFVIPRDITAQDVLEARREALRTAPPPGVKAIKVGSFMPEDVPESATDYFLFMR